MTFTVKASRPLTQPVVVCGLTVPVTAQDGSDYTGLLQCKTLAAGATSVTFTVSVRGDRRKEPDERLAFVAAGAPYVRLGDVLAVGTIVNDD
jgi:hypothetical protein